MHIMNHYNAFYINGVCGSAVLGLVRQYISSCLSTILYSPVCTFTFDAFHFIAFATFLFISVKLFVSYKVLPTDFCSLPWLELILPRFFLVLCHLHSFMQDPDVLLSFTADFYIHVHHSPPAGHILDAFCETQPSWLLDSLIINPVCFITSSSEVLLCLQQQGSQTMIYTSLKQWQTLLSFSLTLVCLLSPSALGSCCSCRLLWIKDCATCMSCVFATTTWLSNKAFLTCVYTHNIHTANLFSVFRHDN